VLVVIHTPHLQVLLIRRAEPGWVGKNIVQLPTRFMKRWRRRRCVRLEETGITAQVGQLSDGVLKM
jgi:hypothetical protein